MKIFRRILLALLAVILILIVVGFFLPRHVHVKRSVEMRAAGELIFDQINSFRKWKSWSPWLQMDTNMKISYSGPEKGTGATFTYHSDNKDIGDGKLTITNSVAYDSIIMDMDFMENGKATGKFYFAESDSGTMVTWVLESDLGNNPVSRWFGLFMDNMIGNDLEKGLDNIRQIVAALASDAGPGVQEKEAASQLVLSIRDTCSPSTIGSRLGLIYGKISEMIKVEKLTLTGAPFAIYHSYSPKLFDIEVGLPVNAKIESSDEIKCR